jgi:hypothetical protein
MPSQNSTAITFNGKATAHNHKRQTVPSRTNLDKRTMSQNKSKQLRHQNSMAVNNANSMVNQGEFLRPKVLDFQPKSNQVDPLLANRNKKRLYGATGTSSHMSHNHGPTINSGHYNISGAQNSAVA